MGEQAVSYLRVSGRGQVEGDGFPRQREAVEQYAQAHRLDLVEEFRDEGVSGSRSLAQRPGLSALMARLLGNGIRLVLVEKADRLARDLVESELILRELRQVGVRVVEVEGGHDLTAGGSGASPSQKLIRQVLAAVAEFDKESLVLRLRAARARKRRETGRCEGPPPFGSLPGEAEVLARAKQLRRKPRGKPRLSFAKVAERLNAEGHRTRSGRPWSRGTVFHQLSKGG